MEREADPAGAFERWLAERLGASAPAAALAREAEPVIDALAEGVALGRDAPDGLELREALALARLLGRRAAIDGGSATTALGLADGLSVALRALGHELGPATLGALRAVLVEGHAAALLEARERELASANAASVRAWPLAGRCFALVVAGFHDADLLDAALDGAARTLLDADAASCLVQVHVHDARADVLRALVGFDESARVIGVRAVFHGLDQMPLDEHDRLDLTSLERAERLDEALARALEHAGYVVRSEPALLRRLRAFVDRRSEP